MAWFNLAVRSLGATVIMPIGDALGVSNTRAWRFTDYVNEGYKLNPVVYACLRKLREGVASVGMGISIDGEAVQEKDLPPNAQAILKLLKRPNNYQSGTEFRKAWCDHIHLAGSSFPRGYGLGMDEFMGKPRTRKAPKLRLIRPDIVTVEHDYNEIQQYVIHYQDRKETVKPRDMINIKFTDPADEFQGVSPLEPCAYTIDTGNQLQKWNLNLLKNAGVPAGVLIVKGVKKLSAGQRDQIETDFSSRYVGANNAGKVAVLNGETADYKQLAQSHKDMDWNTTKRENMRDTCNALGVPSVLLGDKENMTYSNMEAATADFYENTIIPLCRLFGEEMGNYLFPLYGLEDAAFTPNTENISALQENEAEKITSLAEADWMTPNEKRAFMPASMRLEPHPDPVADELYLVMPGSKVPLQPDQLDEAEPADDDAPVDEDNKKKKDEEKDDAKRSTRDEPEFPTSKYQTLETRAAYLGDIYAKRAEWEPEFGEKIIEYWAGQQKRVLAKLGLRSATRDALPDEIFDPKVELVRYSELVEPVQTAIVIEFGQQAMDELLADGTLFNVERPQMGRWLADNLAERSALINDTTATEIRRILLANADLPAPERAELIGKYYTQASEGRVKNIARTEVGRADTKATLEGYSQAGEKLGRRVRAEWITARDGRVRGSGKDIYSHIVMDGVTSNDDDVFETGQVGEVEGPLMDGPAAWVCNCRCGVAPYLEDK